MNEKKEGIFTRLKNAWNNLDDTGKSGITGTVLGIIVTSVAACVTHSVSMKRSDEFWNNYSEDEYQRGFNKGVQTGQMKAYQDLLIGSGQIFQKMNMKVEKF